MSQDNIKALEDRITRYRDASHTIKTLGKEIIILSYQLKELSDPDVEHLIAKLRSIELTLTSINGALPKILHNVT